MPVYELRRGDLVEVRGPAEILATLDPHGMVAELPFMPEMAVYCGRRFVVESRAEKICDTIKYTGSRRLKDAVFLADLRCDGSGHGGCQAECRLIWKEAWLRKIDAGAQDGAQASDSDIAALARRMAEFVKKTPGTAGEHEVWSCQATELLNATDRLGTFDPRAYVREYTCGNASFARFASISARALVEESLRKVGLNHGPHLAGPGGAKTDEPPLDLQPGELVQVRSKEEIAATLNPQGYNRGLWFDREMIAYCGGTFRVRKRIKRFIDDRYAKMVDLKSECVTLENVVCTGDRSIRRWFCPRHAYPYWREIWLKRVPQRS